MLPPQENIDFKSLYLVEQQKNEKLETKLLQLEYQIQQLTKFLNGFKTETFVPTATHPAQKELGLVMDSVADVKIITEEVTVTKKKTQTEIKVPGPAQGVIPDNVRRETEVIEPKEDVSGYEKIGELISEKLSWKQGEIFARR